MNPDLDRRQLLAAAGLAAGHALVVDARRFGEKIQPRSPTIPLPKPRHLRPGLTGPRPSPTCGSRIGRSICSSPGAASPGSAPRSPPARRRCARAAACRIARAWAATPRARSDAHRGRRLPRQPGRMARGRADRGDPARGRGAQSAPRLGALRPHALRPRGPRATRGRSGSTPRCTPPTIEAGKITRVCARCDKTETIHRVAPKLVVDATGDGRLALEAGAEFRTGREPRSEFEEPLALEKGDANSQGSSILFTARQHDQPMPFRPPPWARKITEQDLLFRKIPAGSYEYGVLVDRARRHPRRDPRKRGAALRVLRIVLGVWDWIKNSGQRPDSARTGRCRPWA